jgi:hypothetical protein
MSGIIIAAVILLILFLLRKRFRRPVPHVEVIANTKILISSLGREAGTDLEERDAAVYSKFYRHVDIAKARKADEMLVSISGGDYDVVHLFCEISGDGHLVAESGLELKGGDLLKACREGDVKLLFIAEGNPADNYLKAFTGDGSARGIKLNFVRTLDRKGEAFTQFLEALLQRMSAGEGMPVAWVNVAPQIPGKSQDNQPDLYFSAGRGGIRLLP